MSKFFVTQTSNGNLIDQKKKTDKKEKEVYEDEHELGVVQLEITEQQKALEVEAVSDINVQSINLNLTSDTSNTSIALRHFYKLMESQQQQNAVIMEMIQQTLAIPKKEEQKSA